MPESLKIIRGGSLDDDTSVNNIIKAMDTDIYSSYNLNDVHEHYKYVGGNKTAKLKRKNNKTKKNTTKKNHNTSKKTNLKEKDLFKNLGISPLLYTKIHNVVKKHFNNNINIIVKNLKKNKKNKKIETISDDMWENFIDLTCNQHETNCKSKKNKSKKNKSKKNTSRNKKKPLIFNFSFP